VHRSSGCPRAARRLRVFFLLGFTLFALIYAAMGSFVSRPDDLQTLSLPLSLLAVLGYLSAIGALSGGGGTWTRIASFLPPFSPFVMLARLMVAAVEPRQPGCRSVCSCGHRGRRGRGYAMYAAACWYGSAPASGASSRRPASLIATA
jgi:hypothetical protein